MASNDFIQAINEHVMGDRSEFDALKERFQEDFYWCADKSTAAALAYLIAKDELEAEKEEEEEEEPDVYDEAVEVMKKYGHPHSHISPHTATDEIFTLIYKWLDEGLKKKGHPPNGRGREDIKELFPPFIINEAER